MTKVAKKEHPCRQLLLVSFTTLSSSVQGLFKLGQWIIGISSAGNTNHHIKTLFKKYNFTDYLTTFVIVLSIKPK